MFLSYLLKKLSLGRFW